MSLDPKLEKKIDTLYRNTKQMPLLAIVGIFIPIVLVIGGPLGLLYWFWRRALLEAADSGKLPIDSAPPPIPSAGRVAQLSSTAKIDYIRSHKHALLIPLYLLGVVVLAISALVGYIVITHKSP